MHQGSLIRKVLILIFLSLVCPAGQTGIGMMIAPDPEILGGEDPGKSDPWEADSIESFIDRLIVEQMEKYHIPGIGFVLVRDSNLILKKGYGYSDPIRKIPVNPDSSVFYAGSVSKLFTATAIMQLYEQGKLRLDEDVNRYLMDFRIDENFPEPVTVKQLLTHTAGFEERVYGMASLTDSGRVSPEDFLSSGKYPRVQVPGKYISYSNYGYTLLGYLVECISGLSFEEYVRRNILEPLGMENSSFSHPEELFRIRASSYLYRNDEYTELERLYLNVRPAGSLMCTAEDMSRFIMAHLSGGELYGRRILREETVTLMHSQLFTEHPLLAGWCCGFCEQYVNGIRYIEHPGDIYGYSSLLAIIPEKGVGFYLCANGTDRMLMDYREVIMDRFTNRFFPSGEINAVPGRKKVRYETSGDPGQLNESPRAIISDNLKRYRGLYRMNRYSRLSIEKISCLVLQSTIRIIDDHTLGYSLPRFAGYPTDTLRYVEPLIFKDARTGRYAVFYEDEHGRITHLNISGTIPANFEKVPRYTSMPVQLSLIIFFLLAFLHFSIGWPLRIWIRRIRKKEPSGNIPYRGVRAAMVICSFTGFLFMTGFALVLVIKGQYLAISIPRALTAILILPFFTMAAFLYMMGSGAVKWRISGWTLSGRLQYLTLFTIMLLYFWFLNYWNLIGLNY